MGLISDWREKRRKKREGRDTGLYTSRERETHRYDDSYVHTPAFLGSGYVGDESSSTARSEHESNSSDSHSGYEGGGSSDSSGYSGGDSGGGGGDGGGGGF